MQKSQLFTPGYEKKPKSVKAALIFEETLPVQGGIQVNLVETGRG